MIADLAAKERWIYPNIFRMHQLIDHWRLRWGRPGKRTSNWRKITGLSFLPCKNILPITMILNR